jgi:uncharacterized membrane protein YozB (DUF420 family)
MSELLHNLRAKPEKTKHKIALLTAFVVTVVIVGVYVLVTREKPKAVAGEQSTGEELKPLFQIFKKAKTDFKDIKEGAQNYKKAE